jgi:hypothetical protein
MLACPYPKPYTLNPKHGADVCLSLLRGGVGGAGQKEEEEGRATKQMLPATSSTCILKSRVISHPLTCVSNTCLALDEEGGEKSEVKK